MTRKKKTAVKIKTPKTHAKKNNAARLLGTKKIAKNKAKERCQRKPETSQCEEFTINIKGSPVHDLPALIRELPTAKDIKIVVDNKSRDNRVLQLIIAVVIWLAGLYIFWRLFHDLPPEKLSPTLSSTIVVGLSVVLTIGTAVFLRSTGLLSEQNFMGLMRLGFKYSLVSAKHHKGPQKKNE